MTARFVGNDEFFFQVEAFSDILVSDPVYNSLLVFCALSFSVVLKISLVFVFVPALSLVDFVRIRCQYSCGLFSRLILFYLFCLASDVVMTFFGICCRFLVLWGICVLCPVLSSTKLACFGFLILGLFFVFFSTFSIVLSFFVSTLGLKVCPCASTCFNRFMFTFTRFFFN